MIPAQILKAMGKVLTYSGNNIDHHLRNLMLEIESHFIQEHDEKNPDAISEEVDYSATRDDPVNKLPSSFGKATGSVAMTGTWGPRSNTTRAKRRVEVHIPTGKRRYNQVECEAEDDPAGPGNGGDAEDEDSTSSHDIYVEGKAKRKAAPLSQSAKRARTSSSNAGVGVVEGYNERYHCSACQNEVSSGCWLTICGHPICNDCQARLVTLEPRSKPYCPSCGRTPSDATPLDERNLRRYQRGCKISHRLAAQTIEEGSE